MLDAILVPWLPDTVGAALAVTEIAAVLTGTRWALRALWRAASGA